MNMDSSAQDVQRFLETPPFPLCVSFKIQLNAYEIIWRDPATKLPHCMGPNMCEFPTKWRFLGVVAVAPRTRTTMARSSNSIRKTWRFYLVGGSCRYTSKWTSTHYLVTRPYNCIHNGSVLISLYTLQAVQRQSKSSRYLSIVLKPTEHILLSTWRCPTTSKMWDKLCSNANSHA